MALKFSRTDKTTFFRTLNKRVNSYFRDNNIQKWGNWKLYVKSVVLFSVFLTPYFLILSNLFSQWMMLLLSVVTGIGMAGVGMCVMHEGNHGTYSNKKWINNLMGSSIYILAGNVYNWKVQHNILHHTFTNVHKHDDDLKTSGLIRLNKHSRWMFLHQFQHFYSIFFYGLLTVNWAVAKDFKQMRRYMKQKLSVGKLPNPMAEWSILVITKIIYLLIWIVMPIVVLDIAWWKVLVGFFVMHYTAGLILSMIFQLAHIVENADMPIPDKEGTLENSWAVHQLFTTANFSRKNKWISWYIGGLNFQIEHHMFPNISHIHYKKISCIVRKTALEFGLPYNEFKTTRAAIISHFGLLKELGKKPKLLTKQ